jgi:hypothetical protein
MEDGFSTEYCLTFPQAGMMQNGRLYRLSMPEHRISAKGSGLWPTPRAVNPGSRPNGKGGKVLAEEVKKALWPTPRASCGNGPGGPSLETAVRTWETPTGNDAKNSLTDSSHEATLAARVIESLFPTPGTTGLSNGSGNCEKINTLFDKGLLTDDERRSMRSGNGGWLNPDWVEALMGYPQGWTDIDWEDIAEETGYPGAWLDGTWEEGIPRVLPDVKNRTDRLKCLGNAVVPQILALIWILVLKTVWR